MGVDGARFDFAFIPAGPYQEVVDLVQRGEALGYRGAWLPDQTFHRDPFAMLSLAASNTERIRLGLGITSPFTRLPAQIARGAATVDEISGGRFRLGLGVGNSAHVLAPLGIRARRSVGRLRDAITIIRLLIRGESVEFEGDEDTLRGVRLDFAPLRAEIPIYLGTRGPQTLALAGEIADGVLMESLFNAGGLPFAFESLRNGAARSGRSLDAFDAVSWQMVRITDDVAAAVEAQKPWMVRKIRVGPAQALRRIGIDPDVLETVNACLDEGDEDGALAAVTAETVKCAMIIGTPEEVAARVARILDKGADSVCLMTFGPMSELHTTLQRFAKDVMPLIDA